MSLIMAAIILLIIGLCLWGVYHLASRAVQGVPLVITGIVLILIFLACAFHFLGGRF